MRENRRIDKVSMKCVGLDCCLPWGYNCDEVSIVCETWVFLEVDDVGADAADWFASMC